MAISLWQLRNDLNLKDAASNTQGNTRSSVNYLRERKSEYSRIYYTVKLMKTFSLTVSFFALTSLSTVFLLSAFCILSHFKIIIFWNHWSLLQLIFCWNTTEKRKRERCFSGVRVWAPKPVYRSPKRPEYVTDHLVFIFAKNEATVCIIKSKVPLIYVAQ